MTLRTPRRRISPKTKRRYRAIKGFFKRAIGSASQPDLQITSSIAVNVSDIKHKVVGLEKQLSEVSKHYRECPCLERQSRQESQSLIPTCSKYETKQPDIIETQVLYKTPENQSRKSNDVGYLPLLNSENYVEQNPQPKVCCTKLMKRKEKKSNYHNLENPNNMNTFARKHKSESVYENLVSAYSTSSFHSLDELREMYQPIPGYSGKRDENKCPIKVHNEEKRIRREFVKNANVDSLERPRDEPGKKHGKNRKSKYSPEELDEDFIADIIRRQYKPIKMFGRKQSDMSQFSTPICCDRDFYLNESIQEDSHLCSCCCGGQHYTRRAHHSDHSDIRSVCDTRLYSSKSKHRRKHDAYNDSNIYDLVPVKEKSSPKSRRKFSESHVISDAYYKEVPPSPRTHRPRLNLKTQYVDSDANGDFVQHFTRKMPPKRPKNVKDAEEYKRLSFQQNKNSIQLQNLNKINQQVQISQGVDTATSGLVTTNGDNIATDSISNNTEDKTDKALGEIKDILQCFLQEIKKETSLHSGKSDVSTKVSDNHILQNDYKQNTNTMPASGHNLNNIAPPFPVAPNPYMSAFASNCCYPILPMCPLNCMQNGYVIPSPSFTCGSCVNKPFESNRNENACKIDAANDTYKNETDKLIKEIYKFVTKSPTFSRKQEDSSRSANNSWKVCNSVETKMLTSRSAGGSTQVWRHDAKVGTPKLKCYSKSCEAIGSRIISDSYTSDTNASYSDTVLEKHDGTATTLDATTTQSTSATEHVSGSFDKNMNKKTKVARVLKTLGLYKKKSRDVIEELSESEETVEAHAKKKHPYRQEVMNYMVHGEEYDRPPPVLQSRRTSGYSHSYQPYDPRIGDYNPNKMHDIYDYYKAPPQHIRGHYHPSYSQEPHTPTPPCCHSVENHNHMQPQVPLCLKEIEVKSIACQSERKMSFLKKLTKKMPQSGDARYNERQKTCSTQTTQNKTRLFSSWTKGMDDRNDPISFSNKTRKNLAESDFKMRKKMLKKLFHKKNPFSPRNLIIRTLMGKDPSSYGNPPAAYRPRMFI